MNTDNKEKHTGVAALFDRVELKNFFTNYLCFIIVVEVLIFLVSFLGNMGPQKGPFPWKFYFYVSFITPVAITFLLGVFILAFNQFISGNPATDGEDGTAGAAANDNRSRLFQFKIFIALMKKMPLLPLLFMLVVAAILFYKLDAIFLFILNAGDKMVTYSLIGCGVLMTAGLIFGLAWLIGNYKLRKKQMEHEYRYRNDVMDKLGFLIMQDNTVIDKNGNLINHKHQLPPPLHEPAHKREALKILPPSN